MEEIRVSEPGSGGRNKGFWAEYLPMNNGAMLSRTIEKKKND